MACDPLEAKYAGMSAYNYGFNNPIKWQDADGMQPGDGDDSLKNYKPTQKDLAGLANAERPTGKSTGAGCYSYSFDSPKTGSAADNTRVNTVVNILPIALPNLRPWLAAHTGQETLAAPIPSATMSAKRVEHMTPGRKAAHDAKVEQMLHDVGYKSDGISKLPLKKLEENNTFKAASDNLVKPTLELWGAAETGGAILNIAKGVIKAATANAIKTIAVNAGDDVALTRGDNLALGLRTNLDEFSAATGFKNYRQFTSGGFKANEIEAAIKNDANNLHFNLTDFARWKYLRYISNPTAPTLGNITNWELHTIYNTPGAIERTTFYKFINSSYQIVPKPF